MTRYNPMTVFPLFVLVVVIAGILYTLDSKSRFRNEPLAQTHIVDPSPNTDPPNPTVPEQQIELKAPLNELKYPETKSISESTTAIRLESEMDTETISNWYKEKVKQLGYKADSVTAANSNGNIEHRLVGKKANEAVYIEIKKPNGLLKTAINIEISNL